MLGKYLQLKTTTVPVSLLSVVSKIFGKLINNRIVNHLEKCGHFSDFQWGFRLSQSTADLFTVISHLVLFLVFWVIDSYKWFWMGSLHKNIQLMLEFKAPFLVLHFSCYTLMTFLTMLSVILLSMLMILLSILSVIRHLICGNNLNWLLILNLIYETLWTGGWDCMLISMLGKLNWFCLISLIILVQLMWKWMGLFLRKNHLSRCWGWASLLNWIGALILSLLLKLPTRKVEP